MQNTFLFAKSLEENIKISSDHLGREDVEKAAKVSSIHDSIMGFEEGYETLVGEKVFLYLVDKSKGWPLLEKSLKIPSLLF